MKILFFPIFLILTNFLFAQIAFDANIESGNLKSVQVIDSTTFNITTQEDVGIDGGSSRWFYFRISGVKNKNVKVTFTNTDVTKAMYSYDNKNFSRFSDDEVPTSGSFQKTFIQDTVYVSYYTPYTFSYLQERISEWQNSQYVLFDTLGFTPKGFPIQEMIITDFSVPFENKKTVWIHSRTHPSETPSSWHFDGIVQELLSNKEVPNYYLTQFEFHLIPFTNPDGVYYGRSRVNYEGINLEPNWDKPANQTSEEVKILRARMKELNDQKPFSVFLNLHSQVSSYCTFWVHTAVSTSGNFYTRENQFAYLNISDNKYFLKNDLRFSDLRSVYPEGWLWDNYGDQVMALTYETPYNNYFKSTSEPIVEVTNDNLFEIGKRTLYAIAEYLEVNHPKHYIMDNTSSFTIGDYSNYSEGLEYYGSDFTVLNTNAENTYITYTSETFPAGKYDLSAWWATSSGNSYETVFEITAGSNNYEVIKTQKINGGQWNYLTNIELAQTGTISIRVESNTTGLVVADAFRLIYSGQVTGIDENIVPTDFVLYQNYPNPFNPTTTIKYSIPLPPLDKGRAGVGSKVTLKIYDILGREITTLVNKYQSPGEHEITFNAAGLASGHYIYTLQFGNYFQSKKMILLK